MTVRALVGRDEREGVVDAYGRVFNYPGLHIADGSVMPGPVGPNTIAGLADRFADAIIEEMTGFVSFGEDDHDSGKEEA